MTVKRTLSSETATTAGVVQVLIDAGIKHVYGIPGGETGRIFRELERRSADITTIVVRQETLASAMAETTGRLTGLPGVLIGQGPWALGFGITGTLEAHLSSSPMLILSDYSDRSGYTMHAPYQCGSGDYGSWDIAEAFRGICKRVVEARTPVDAVHGTQLAIKHAMTGERGPVAVLYAASALSGTVGPESRPRIYETRRYVPVRSGPIAADEIAECRQRLLKARKAVALVGNGVRISGAEAELAAFVEAFDLAVATTPSGKGCFPETDPRAIGVLGTFGTKAANAAISEADFLIWIGSKAGVGDTGFENPQLLDPERQDMVQIDIEPLNAGRSFPCDQVLIGDARQILSQLAEGAKPIERKDGGIAWVRQARGKQGYFEPMPAEEAGQPLQPKFVVEAIQKAWGKDGIVACDAGENRLFMMHFFQTARVGGYLQAAGVGPMGYAIPSAMAAKMLNPDMPVAAVLGDGGFAMSMNGLMTAVENGIGIGVVVFNNDGLGWSIHGGATAKRFHPYDLARIAETLGCRGIRVEKAADLPGALRAAHEASKVPTVVDIAVSMEPTFKDITAPFAVPLYPRS